MYQLLSLDSLINSEQKKSWKSIPSPSSPSIKLHVCHGLSDLLLLVFLWMLAYCLWRSDTHLCGLEGLQTIPHGPLEDLLHFIFIFIDFEMTPAVSVSVLWTRKQTEEEIERNGAWRTWELTFERLDNSLFNPLSLFVKCFRECFKCHECSEYERSCSPVSCLCTGAAAAGGEC